MSYTSFNFFLFVSVAALIYFLFPLKRFRWVVLLCANMFFYAVAGYRWSMFILFTTASTYLAALWIENISFRSRKLLQEKKGEWSREAKQAFKNRTTRRKRLVMALALVLNFGILAFLKYYNFFAGSLNEVLGALSIELSAPTLKLFLPLGISFYTFQSMGYVVDVYREKTLAQKNPLKLLLFISFFPQIIQGPISIYDQLAHQLYVIHDFDFTRFKHGCELILWGFFKKMVIADRAVIAINAVTSSYSSYAGSTLTFTVLLYSLQLYADFSGGIDISRGVAQIFDIELTENFKRPYFSTSISQYWQRWHISLGTWMKCYVFYPLATSKLFLSAGKSIKKTRFGKTAAGAHIAKVLPTGVASLIVFLLVGVWHGASWKFVAFGLWNGGVIMLSILLQPVFDGFVSALRINRKNPLFVLFQMARTFIVVLVGYVFDVAPSFAQAMMTFRLLFTDFDLVKGAGQIQKLGLTNNEYLMILVSAIVLLTVSIIREKHEKKRVTLRELLDRKPFIIRWLLIFAAVMTIIIFGAYGSGYNAADFVYMQF